MGVFSPTGSPMGAFVGGDHCSLWEESDHCRHQGDDTVTRNFIQHRPRLITITKDDDHDNVSEDIGDDHDVDDDEGDDLTTAIKDTGAI